MNNYILLACFTLHSLDGDYNSNENIPECSLKTFCGSIFVVDKEYHLSHNQCDLKKWYSVQEMFPINSINVYF